MATTSVKLLSHPPSPMGNGRTEASGAREKGVLSLGGVLTFRGSRFQFKLAFRAKITWRQNRAKNRSEGFVAQLLLRLPISKENLWKARDQSSETV